MSATVYLRPIYQFVFQEEFDYLNSDKRKKFQAAVYLLIQSGLNIGEYSFQLSDHTPFSIILLNDIEDLEANEDKTVEFSPTAKEKMERLREILTTEPLPNTYDETQLVECLAICHHFLSSKELLDPEEVLLELSENFPNYGNVADNKIVLAKLLTMFPEL